MIKSYRSSVHDVARKELIEFVKGANFHLLSEQKFYGLLIVEPHFAVDAWSVIQTMVKVRRISLE